MGGGSGGGRDGCSKLPGALSSPFTFLDLSLSQPAVPGEARFLRRPPGLFLSFNPKLPLKALKPNLNCGRRIITRDFLYKVKANAVAVAES